MPRLSEAQKSERRERILAGARRCFARHGYEGATVVRLEEEIGLSRGAIFNWFPSKEELFLALAARDNEQLHQVLAESGFEGLLEAVLEHEPDWLAVYHEFGRLFRTDPALRDRWKSISSDEARESSLAWIASGQADGRLRRDVEPDEIARFLGLVIDGVVAQRVFGFDAPRKGLVLRLTRDAVRVQGDGEVQVSD